MSRAVPVGRFLASLALVAVSLLTLGICRAAIRARLSSQAVVGEVRR